MSKPANFLETLLSAQTDVIDVKLIASCLKGNEFRYTGNIQYALHTFCAQRKYGKKEDKIVEDITSLIYSDACLEYIICMDRFSASIAAILEYCLARDLREHAYNLSNILNKKASALKNAPGTKTRHNLYVIATHQINLAVSRASSDAVDAIRIFNTALKTFELIASVDKELAEKFEKRMHYALYHLKALPVETTLRVKDIFSTLLGSKSHANTKILDFLTYKIYLMVSSSSSSDISSVVASDLSLMLKFTNNDKLKMTWNLVIQFFSSNEAKSLHTVSICVGMAQRIISACEGDGGELFLIVLMMLAGCKHWCSSGVVPIPVLKELYSQFIKAIWNKSKHLSDFVVVFGGFKLYYAAELAGALNNIALLIRYSLKNNSEDCLSLLDIFIEVFHLCDNCIEKLERIECDKAKICQLWSNITLPFINSVENLLTLCNENGEWRYMHKFCRSIAPRVVSSERALPFGSYRMNLLLRRWLSSAEKMGDWKDAMLCTSLQVIAFPETQDSAIVNWCRLKLVEGNQFKDLTIVDYLLQEESALRELNPKFDFSKVEKSSLLLSELKAYRTISSPSLLEPMLKVWQALKLCKIGLVEFILGLSCVIFVHVWTANEGVTERYLNDCRKFLQKLSSSKVKNPKELGRKCCYEGVLRFCILICEMGKKDSSANDTFAFSMALKSLVDEAEERAKFGEDVDLNLTCDVAPTGCTKNIEREVEMVNDLIGIVSCWEKIPSLSMDSLSPGDISMLLEHLHLLSILACLYGATIVCVKAWVVYYEIAVHSKDSTAQLYGLSELIKTAEISSDSKLVATAKDLYNSIFTSDEQSQKDVETLINFQLILVEIYITEGNNESGFEALKTCKTLMEKLRSDNSLQILKGRYFGAMSKCLMTQSIEALTLEEQNIQFVTYRGFCYLSTALRNNSSGSLSSSEVGSVLLAMLDNCLWAVKVYKSLRLGRFVRSFVESLYGVFQNLGITSRTAELLTILVEVELITGKLSEAQSKLSDLESLLGLPPLQNRKQTYTVETYLNNHLVVDPVLRDVSPVRFCSDASRPKSPLSFLLPTKETSSNCWDHQPGCTCHFCQSLLVNQIFLASRLAEAVTESMTGDFRTAAILYAKCSDIVKQYNPLALHSVLLKELNGLEDNCRINWGIRSWDASTTTFNIKYSTFLLLPEIKSEGRAVSLMKNVRDSVARLTYEKILLEVLYEELEGTVFTMQKRKEKLKISQLTGSMSRLAVVEHSVPKTPCVLKQRKAVECQAPRRINFEEWKVSPIIKRWGRRVFDESKPTTTANVKKTVATTSSRKVQPSASAPKSSTTEQTMRRPGEIVIKSDEDSPKILTVKKQNDKATFRTPSKPKVLQFNESDTVSQEGSSRRTLRKKNIVEEKPKLCDVPIDIFQSSVLVPKPAISEKKTRRPRAMVVESDEDSPEILTVKKQNDKATFRTPSKPKVLQFNESDTVSQEGSSRRTLRKKNVVEEKPKLCDVPIDLFQSSVLVPKPAISEKKTRRPRAMVVESEEDSHEVPPFEERNGNAPTRTLEPRVLQCDATDTVSKDDSSRRTLRKKTVVEEKPKLCDVPKDLFQSSVPAKSILLPKPAMSEKKTRRPRAMVVESDEDSPEVPPIEKRIDNAPSKTLEPRVLQCNAADKASQDDISRRSLRKKTVVEEEPKLGDYSKDLFESFENEMNLLES